MRVGIVMTARPGVEDLAARAEELGFNYLGWIEPGDRDLVVPSPMDKLGLIGTRPELLQRIAAIEAAGVSEIVILPVVDPAAEMNDLAALMA
jgi:5,10-methylenetetrahydromethanopterin reductase